jgi:hypothetical protein
MYAVISRAVLDVLAQIFMTTPILHTPFWDQIRENHSFSTDGVPYTKFRFPDLPKVQNNSYPTYNIIIVT